MNGAGIYIEYDAQRDQYLLLTPTTCGHQSMCDEYGESVDVHYQSLDAGSYDAALALQKRLLGSTSKFRRLYP